MTTATRILLADDRDDDKKKEVARHISHHSDGSAHDKSFVATTGAIVGCSTVGLPIRIFQPNDNLTIAFDTRTKSPAFVMERLRLEKDDTNGKVIAASRKNKRFHEEQSLLPYHRSRNQYYKNSGYDRGHLAPAADFAINDDEMNDTFSLSNISPQLPTFNRLIWLRVEEFVRHIAKQEASSDLQTYVVTGPLWLPSSTTTTETGAQSFLYSYSCIGNPPSLVAVPTHFFKVILVVDEKSQSLKKIGAFVLPSEFNFGSNKSIRLVDYLVRLTDLEAVSGLEFFPSLLGTYDMYSNDSIPLQKEIVDALTDDIRLHHERRLEQKGEPSKKSNSLVPIAKNSNELSKGRQKKIKQILRENDVMFEHLCRNNNACYKILRV